MDSSIEDLTDFNLTNESLDYIRESADNEPINNTTVANNTGAAAPFSSPSLGGKRSSFNAGNAGTGARRSSTSNSFDAAASAAAASPAGPQYRKSSISNNNNNPLLPVSSSSTAAGAELLAEESKFQFQSISSGLIELIKFHYNTIESQLSKLHTVINSTLKQQLSELSLKYNNYLLQNSNSNSTSSNSNNTHYILLQLILGEKLLKSLLEFQIQLHAVLLTERANQIESFESIKLELLHSRTKITELNTQIVILNKTNNNNNNITNDSNNSNSNNSNPPTDEISRLRTDLQFERALRESERLEYIELKQQYQSINEQLTNLRDENRMKLTIEADRLKDIEEQKLIQSKLAALALKGSKKYNTDSNSAEDNNNNNDNDSNNEDADDNNSNTAHSGHYSNSALLTREQQLELQSSNNNYKSQLESSNNKYYQLNNEFLELKSDLSHYLETIEKLKLELININIAYKSLKQSDNSNKESIIELNNTIKSNQIIINQLNNQLSDERNTELNQSELLQTANDRIIVLQNELKNIKLNHQNYIQQTELRLQAFIEQSQSQSQSQFKQQQPPPQSQSQSQPQPQPQPQQPSTRDLPLSDYDRTRAEYELFQSKQKFRGKQKSRNQNQNQDQDQHQSNITANPDQSEPTIQSHTNPKLSLYERAMLKHQYQESLRAAAEADKRAKQHWDGSQRLTINIDSNKKPPSQSKRPITATPFDQFLPNGLHWKSVWTVTKQIQQSHAPPGVFPTGSPRVNNNKKSPRPQSAVNNNNNSKRPQSATAESAAANGIEISDSEDEEDEERELEDNNNEPETDNTGNTNTGAADATAPIGADMIDEAALNELSDEQLEMLEEYFQAQQQYQQQQHQSKSHRPSTAGSKRHNQLNSSVTKPWSLSAWRLQNSNSFSRMSAGLASTTSQMIYRPYVNHLAHDISYRQYSSPYHPVLPVRQHALLRSNQIEEKRSTSPPPDILNEPPVLPPPLLAALAHLKKPKQFFKPYKPAEGKKKSQPSNSNNTNNPSANRGRTGRTAARSAAAADTASKDSNTDNNDSNETQQQSPSARPVSVPARLAQKESASNSNNQSVSTVNKPAIPLSTAATVPTSIIDDSTVSFSTSHLSIPGSLAAASMSSKDRIELAIRSRKASVDPLAANQSAAAAATARYESNNKSTTPTATAILSFTNLTIPQCEICDSRSSEIHCRNCGMYLCIMGGCDSEIHNGNNKSHQRQKLIIIQTEENKSPTTVPTPAPAPAPAPVTITVPDEVVKVTPIPEPAPAPAPIVPAQPVLISPPEPIPTSAAAVAPVPASEPKSETNTVTATESVAAVEPTPTPAPAAAQSTPAPAAPESEPTPASKPTVSEPAPAPAPIATPAPSSAAASPPTLCDLCDDEPAVFYCNECRMNLCTAGNCDSDVHKPISKQNHKRNAL